MDNGAQRRSDDAGFEPRGLREEESQKGPAVAGGPESREDDLEAEPRGRDQRERESSGDRNVRRDFDGAPDKIRRRSRDRERSPRGQGSINQRLGGGWPFVAGIWVGKGLFDL